MTQDPREFCPGSPDWRLDWGALDASLPIVRAMRGVPQDPVFHAEGDVWVHTRMVCEAMVAMPQWRAADPEDRQALFVAALFHDNAKPSCTREEGGRIRSPGHAPRGEIDARVMMWEAGLPFDWRERVALLIRYHGLPLHALSAQDPDRRVIAASIRVRCDHLAMLARADVLGRQCADQAELLERVELFEELARELDCYDQPYPFASDYSRVQYMLRPGRDPGFAAYDDTWGEVVVMSGLPASGKDHYIAHHCEGLPVVSLDAIREETGAPPTGKQGPVVNLARERATELLRGKQPFVWNSTNLSRDLRAMTLNLIHRYGASVRLVYTETGPSELYKRNNARSSPVPAEAYQTMFQRWQVPDQTEAERLEVRLT